MAKRARRKGKAETKPPNATRAKARPRAHVRDKPTAAKPKPGANAKATPTAAKPKPRAKARDKPTAARPRPGANAKATPTAGKPRPKRAKPTASVDPKRFARASGSSTGSSHAASWRPPRGDRGARSNDLTEFLGRLWALFGPPTGDNGKGFEYDIVDTTTGELVQAYAAASGPSFGSPAGRRTEAIDALEALINATRSVDCETTVDYGASQIGIKGGKHFYDYRGTDDDTFAD